MRIFEIEYDRPWLSKSSHPILDRQASDGREIAIHCDDSAIPDGQVTEEISPLGTTTYTYRGEAATEERVEIGVFRKDDGICTIQHPSEKTPCLPLDRIIPFWSSIKNKSPAFCPDLSGLDVELVGEPSIRKDGEIAKLDAEYKTLVGIVISATDLRKENMDEKLTYKLVEDGKLGEIKAESTTGYGVYRILFYEWDVKVTDVNDLKRIQLVAKSIETAGPTQ